jgi:hypothetical protein
MSVAALCIAGQANLGAQTPTVEVRLLDQSKSTKVGTIIDSNIDVLQLKTSQGVENLLIETLESINFHESALTKIESPIKIGLLDGSELVVSECELVDQKIEARLGIGINIQPPKRKVRSIIFERPESRRKLASHVSDVLRDDSIAADTLVVFRKGEFNVIEGIVNKLGRTNVEFSIDDQTAEVNLAKVSAITFFKAGATNATNDQYSDPFATCQLADGSVLRLRRFSVNQDKINAITLTGQELNLVAQNLISLSFKTTTTVPISELPPTTNDWTPLLAPRSIQEHLRQLRLARFDSSFDGPKISLDVPRTQQQAALGKTPTITKTFDSGIAIYGGGRIAWQLGGDYKLVRGSVGFAPSASPLGQVNFRIIADGRLVSELPMQKSEMKGPADFEVEIDDCQRMVFEIDYADGNSIGDLVHMVDVVLEK